MPPLDVGTGSAWPCTAQRARVGRLARRRAPSTVTLRPIARRLGLGRRATVVALCEWAAWRWAGPWSKLLATASPPRVVAELPAAAGARRAARGAQPAARHGPAARARPRRDARARRAVHGPAGPRRSACCTAWPRAAIARLGRGHDADDGLGASASRDRLRRRGVAAAAGPDRWAEARAGLARRRRRAGGALAPVPCSRAAVVLDAHDDAYRQTQTPCWSAVGRARRALPARAGARSSPRAGARTPRSSRSCADASRAEHEAGMWPRIVVADLRAADPRERLLTSQLAVQAHRALDEPRHGRARRGRPPAPWRRPQAPRVPQLRRRSRSARRTDAPCTTTATGSAATSGARGTPGSASRAAQGRCTRCARASRRSRPTWPRCSGVEAVEVSAATARGARGRAGRGRHRGRAHEGATRRARVLRGPRRLPERAARPRGASTRCARSGSRAGSSARGEPPRRATSSSRPASPTTSPSTPRSAATPRPLVAARGRAAPRARASRRTSRLAALQRPRCGAASPRRSARAASTVTEERGAFLWSRARTASCATRSPRCSTRDRAGPRRGRSTGR